MTKRTGPGPGKEWRQGPCVLLWEIKCLRLLFSASSPSPHYLWEPQFHKGKGQPAQTEAAATLTPARSPSKLCLRCPTPFFLYIMSLAYWDF